MPEHRRPELQQIALPEPGNHVLGGPLRQVLHQQQPEEGQGRPGDQPAVAGGDAVVDTAPDRQRAEQPRRRGHDRGRHGGERRPEEESAEPGGPPDELRLLSTHRRASS